VNRRILLTWAVLSFSFGSLFGFSISNWVKGYINSGNNKKSEYLNEQRTFSYEAQEEVKQVAHELLNNRVQKADTLNVNLFSKWLLEFYRDAKMSDPRIYANYIQSVDPVDYADIIGIVLLTSDTARVFVDQGKEEDSSINVYRFIKEQSGWRFDNYEFKSDI
jgi:hypothetical protein